MEGRRQRRFADCRPASRAKEAAIAVGIGDAQLMVKLTLPQVQAECVVREARIRILICDLKKVFSVYDEVWMSLALSRNLPNCSLPDWSSKLLEVFGEARQKKS
jgi:hypothetical protein